MTEHKYTDEEVIKALEVCVDNSSCKECPINPNHGNYGYCTNLALTYAIDLINRQKAELEDLREIVFTDRSEAIKNLKAEAIKEFAEKLKEKAYVNKPYGVGKSVDECDIDALVKEMTEI